MGESDMKCPSCETKMKVRNGKFGEFYFCPKQHICKQKTITKEVISNSNSNSSLYDLVKSSEGVVSNPYETSALEIHYQLCKDHLEWLYGSFYD